MYERIIEGIARYDLPCVIVVTIPLPDLPPAFYDPYPETYSATDIAAME
jgi:hypothetical protein